MKPITNEVLAEKIDRLGEDVVVVKELLTGNGEPSKGLVVRVDRLEQVESRRKWTVRAIAGTLMSLIASHFVR